VDKLIEFQFSFNDFRVGFVASRLDFERLAVDFDSFLTELCCHKKNSVCRLNFGPSVKNNDYEPSYSKLVKSKTTDMNATYHKQIEQKAAKSSSQVVKRELKVVKRELKVLKSDSQVVKREIKVFALYYWVGGYDIKAVKSG
jgi:hypothetical protein